MAKGMYIGVDNKARKVKQIYVGVETLTYNDPYTLLLLHGESIADSSPKGQTITNSGVSVSTAQKKFGNSSLYFNGSSTLRLPSLNFGTGDFTIDFWIYPSTLKGYFLSGYSSGLTGSVGVGFRNSTTIGVLRSSVAWDTEATVSISTNKWTHLAFVRNKGTVYLFVNGSLVGSGSNTNNYSTSTATVIGAEGGSEYFTGYIDEYRISNVARWTSNFSVPTAPYEIYEVTKPVARRVKKAYIGIGGVARPFWGDKKLQYYGTITGLSVAKIQHAATTVGNYGLFAGGDPVNDKVDAYNTSLTRTNPTGLSNSGRDGITATTLGGYALFAGGGSSSAMDAYDTNLTRTATTLDARRDMAATSVGDNALFGGGYQYSIPKDDMAVVNKSLTVSYPRVYLSVARGHLSATTVGDYGVFAGGIKDSSGNVTNTVCAFNKSIVRTVPAALSVARCRLTATTVGNYALFAGGDNGNNTSYATVDAYNASLTRSTITSLSAARYALASTTVENCALFGGGYGTTFLATVDVYDASLTRTTTTNLSVARDFLASTTVGKYALFGGGLSASSTYRDTVDAYVFD